MTIKDIAKECGVGLGTVSRVVNDQAGVSIATREKVQAVIKKYGFVLNQNAKLLKAQDRHTIVVLVKGSSSIWLNSLLECIQNRLLSSPYTVDVVFLDEYENEALQACKIFYEWKPVGMIFLGGAPDVYKEDFEKVQIPCVIISNQAHSVDNENLSSVSTDDCDSSAYMAKYLLENGHTSIGIIGGDLKSSDLSRRRYDNFKKVLDDNGIAFNHETQYATAKYSFEGGAEAAKVLMQRSPKITAIFTMSDVMAIGAIRSLKDMGYSVPDDVSITGFDGLDLSEYVCPRLTTIKQQKELLVQQGIEVLLDGIELHKQCEHIFVPFEFIEGESVCKLKK